MTHIAGEKKSFFGSSFAIGMAILGGAIIFVGSKYSKSTDVAPRVTLTSPTHSPSQGKPVIEKIPWTDSPKIIYVKIGETVEFDATLNKPTVAFTGPRGATPMVKMPSDHFKLWWMDGTLHENAANSFNSLLRTFPDGKLPSNTFRFICTDGYGKGQITMTESVQGPAL
ncbi:MAG: hypothetical protein COU07_03530 [Candidatus Harrisonbacteria bacterium CG10_big_fil_rev_8_21_14_0_10_40_38]|uniref:Uncharacterized protein n=1 Tax=Candidatus Harrisonbacteria bacterium CG10_big_fil_rev_8_21_14_0_10_40_38 TaxID=1974583 RepID=A0A2H0UR71_9BACT|nr:MAG: hypothetical protein COU07_03530 [Candidatus Harrisonbacteria bacterium CG10_big_fil_rev_8_21_14_0_10_40_38]